MKRAWLVLTLLLTACGDAVPTASTGTTPMNPNTPHVVPAQTWWTQAQADMVMMSLTTALNDMVATQIDGATATTAPLQVNVTAACDSAFASNGSIAVLGAYNFLPKSTGQFTVALTFSDCPLKAADGNTYTASAIGLQVAGTTTNTTDPNGSVIYALQCNTIKGTMSLTSLSVNAQCDLQATDNFTTTWNDTMKTQGTYNGSFCNKTLTGSVNKTQTVVQP